MSNRYIRLTWPESQEYMGKEDCYVGNDNDVFVPIEFFDLKPIEETEETSK